jgi:GNAT superfamily N-acetyltransferase
LDRKIGDFNGTKLSLEKNIKEIRHFAVRDAGSIIAGIRTCIYFHECLFISAFFIEEKYRRLGIGRALLRSVETMAKSSGIKLIHLDTFSFQAKDFYLKNGYEIFGILENCPRGHTRYYLQKRYPFS